VGKTTVAQALADRSERAVHLESDRFLHFIRSGYVEPWRPESHEQNEVVTRIVAGAAAAYAAAGYVLAPRPRPSRRCLPRLPGGGRRPRGRDKPSAPD
jgi:hypothetical protein